VGILSALYCSLDNHLGEGCHQMCLGVGLQICEKHLSLMHFRSLRMKLSLDLVGIAD